MKRSRLTPRGQAPLPATALQLSDLLQAPIVNRDGQRVGGVIDVVADRCDGRDLMITGLVAGVDDRQVFVPLKRLTLLDGAVVIDSVARFDKPYRRQPTELLLVADVLGRRLLDVRIAKLVRARDIELMADNGGWTVAGVEVEWGGWWHHLVGPFNRHRGHRRWNALEPLTSTEDGPMVGRFGSGLARLRPADVADLLENASAAERADIQADLANDPELEADVFGELDEDHITKLLEQRDDAAVAALLARMSTDAAADAIATLDHQRLVHVLDLLPAHRRVKLSMLLGYNPTTAGGLMGVEFISVTGTADAKHALAHVADATRIEPQALSSVYLNDHEGRLTGAVTLAELVQAKPGTNVDKLADHDPIRVGPDADTEDVALLMSDHNLLALPVVDSQDHMIGLITVDDVLETTIPIDWRRRAIGSSSPITPDTHPTAPGTEEAP